VEYFPSTTLDKLIWDNFILSNKAHYYNYSFFLDSCAKNWGVYYDDKNQKGFVVCFNIVFGKKILYPPIFGRTIDFINMDQNEIMDYIEILKNEFIIGNIQTETKIEYGFTVKKYQYLHSVNLNTLAKRMIKKGNLSFVASDVIRLSDVTLLIKKELHGKTHELNLENLNKLTVMCKEAERCNNLKLFGAYDKQKLVSGLIFIKNSDTLFYVLGAGETKAKKNGSMYLAMHEAINYGIKNEFKIDFGGSNLDGIRRFYKSFGGKDNNYYCFEWNRAPFWFKFLRFVKRKLS
jgi:hypothetical protein